MIPAIHRRGRHWPTMDRHVPPFVDKRLVYGIGSSPVGNAVLVTAAFFVLVVLAVVLPAL